MEKSRGNYDQKSTLDLHFLDQSHSCRHFPSSTLTCASGSIGMFQCRTIFKGVKTAFKLRYRGTFSGMEERGEKRYETQKKRRNDRR